MRFVEETRERVGHYKVGHWQIWAHHGSFHIRCEKTPWSCEKSLALNREDFVRLMAYLKTQLKEEYEK